VIRVRWFLDNLRAGGAERLPLTLAPAFREVRLSLVLVKDQIEYELPPGLQVTALAPATVRLSRTLPRVCVGALRAARGADLLVGGMEWMPTFCAATCGAALRLPAVAVVATDLPRFHAADGIPGIAWWALRRALASCGAVVAVSEDARISLASLGVPSGRVEVIPNPVPGHPHAPAPREPVPRILSLGRLHPAKGYDVALAAAALLKDLPFRWDIVSEGPEGAALRRRADELGLESCVRFAGFQPDTKPYFAAADLFVLSSRVEGTPLALLEAMAAGLPIVATRCGRGVEDALLDGSAGMLVPPEDPAALAAAIRSLLAEPTRRQDLGAAARRRSLDFAPEVIAERYERLFASLVR
jgi:glycosyltransferase involved in cell wall biosynthesis